MTPEPLGRYELFSRPGPRRPTTSASETPRETRVEPSAAVTRSPKTSTARPLASNVTEIWPHQVVVRWYFVSDLVGGPSTRSASSAVMPGFAPPIVQGGGETGPYIDIGSGSVAVWQPTAPAASQTASAATRSRPASTLMPVCSR